MIIMVRTNKGEREAELIKENPKAVWVRLVKDGKYIKRHKVKHGL